MRYTIKYDAYLPLTRLFIKICLIITAVLFLLLPPATVSAITLNECIDAALEMNPGIEAAAYRVKASRAAHLQARAAWYPQFSASGSYTRTNNPSQAFMMALNRKTLDMTDPDFDPADPGHTDQTRFSLGMQYLLYDGGQSRMREESAKYGIDLSRYELAAARNALVYEVAHGFYATLKAEAFVEVFQETVASIEASLTLARQRYHEGAALKTDVLNLEVQLAQTEEDLINAENSYQMAVAALNTAIGAEIVGPHALIPPGYERPAALINDLEKPSVERRPELQAAALLARVKKSDLRHSRRAYLPTVSAFGSLDMDRRVSDHFEDSYIAGITARWDIFDGYARSGAISGSRAMRNEAVAFLKQTRKQLDLDLKDAGMKLSSARQRRVVTKTALESAAASLEMTRTLYETGAVDITALLNAQAAMTASLVRDRAAFYDYLDAQANLNRAVGKQWPWQAPAASR